MKVLCENIDAIMQCQYHIVSYICSELIAIALFVIYLCLFDLTLLVVTKGSTTIILLLIIITESILMSKSSFSAGSNFTAAARR